MTSATEAQQPAPQDDVFEKRHAQDLGVKKFAKIQATYTFVPLLAAALGGVLGYFALARPVAKLFPEWSKTAGVVEVAGKELKGAISALWAGEDIAKAFEKFTPDPIKLKEIEAIWKDAKLSHDVKKAKIIETLELKLPEVPETFHYASAAGAGTVGLMGGSIAIGYDQWRKNESARLAAEEINHDIANLDLFKPSDAELVAENKRLHTMVAALPTIDTPSAQRQGMVEEKQQEAAK